MPGVIVTKTSDENILELACPEEKPFHKQNQSDSTFCSFGFTK